MESWHNEMFASQIWFPTVNINIIKKHKLSYLVRLKGLVFSIYY